MQYSQENIYAGVFFYLTCRPLAWVFNLKLNLKLNFDPATVFFCKFCKSFKNAFFTVHLRVTVPGVNQIFYVKWIKKGDFPVNL